MNKTTKSKRTAVGGSDQRLVRRWLRINYGLNRREKGKTLHAYGKLRCKGDWASDETHRHIQSLILKRHAEWMITGYALISAHVRITDAAPPSGVEHETGATGRRSRASDC